MASDNHLFFFFTYKIDTIVLIICLSKIELSDTIYLRRYVICFEWK